MPACRLLPVMIALLLPSGLAAADSDLDDVSNMNCGDQIAEIGDQQFEFQQKCGPPTATEENGRIWVYDRRSDDFVYYVSFAPGAGGADPGARQRLNRGVASRKVEIADG